jgi:hypothetical protein
MTGNEKMDDFLVKVDRDKRDFLKKLAIGTAFAIPVVLSFGMDGVKARAQLAKSPGPVSPIG